MFYEIVCILEVLSQTRLKLGLASPCIGDDSPIVFNSFFSYSWLPDDFYLRFHISCKK